MNFFIKLFLNAIAAVITAYILPGVYLQNFGYAVILVVLLSLLNVSLKPILVFLTIPATVFSLGLFLLVINGLMFWAASFVRGFEVNGFWAAFLGALMVTVANLAGRQLLKDNP